MCVRVKHRQGRNDNKKEETEETIKKRTAEVKEGNK
jgi:hypothetical protein